ncbi:g-type lectin s-receptor-like serine/threonine-protein kinase lecrk1 [Quercus suber]|uniref:G-type lectin s-receptor-like serine/threonine-protein kinase lecrk1 n=1 Tax=Quercus suber TaxID=58331 RepID=A0AAW0LKZ8_QUESU
MASAIALFYYHLLAFVITLLVPAIAQVNTNVSVGSALFATDDNSTWTSPSDDFSFGFRRLPGQQDHCKNSSIIWNSFDEPTNTMLTTQVLGFARSLLSTMSEKSFGVGKFQLRFRQQNISNSSYDLILNQIAVYTKNTYGAYYTEHNVSELIMDKSGYLLVKNSLGAISNLSSEGEVLRTESDSYYRATLDFDGVFRLYTHPKNFTGSQTWTATWYVPENICLNIVDTFRSGPCGYNSICSLRAYGKPECQCAPGFSLLDVNNKYTGRKQDDVSYMHECNEMGTVISEDQFEILEIENADWPLTAYELLQPITEFECKKSCLHDCYCAVTIFQDPKYNNGMGRCWKNRLPLSNGRYNRHANPTNLDPGQGKQDQAISILAVLLAAISLLVFCLWQEKLPNFYRTPHTKGLDMNLLETERADTYGVAYDCYSRGKVERLVENDEEAISDMNCVKKLVMVTIWCVQDVPLLRPSMREVSRDWIIGFLFDKSLVGSKKNKVRVLLPTFIKGRCAEIEMERAAILTEWACECYYQGKVERLVENDEEALSDLKWVKKYSDGGNFVYPGCAIIKAFHEGSHSYARRHS